MLETTELNIRHLMDARRYLLFAVGVVLVAVLLLVVGLVPQISASQELLSKRGQETTRLKNLETKAQELQNMASSPIINQMFTVEKVLPSKKPLLEMLSSLNLSARESQVAITSLELTPGAISTESAAVDSSAANAKRRTSATKSKVVDTLNVDLEVEGEISAVNRFIELVEKRAPLSTITSISLRKLSTGGDLASGNERFGATLTVSSHFFAQSVTSTVESALPKLDDKQQQLLSELRSFLIPEEQIQREIQGGGLIDLFGVDQPELEAAF